MIDPVLTSLVAKQKHADRNQDHLRSAWLRVLMAEHQTTMARKGLEMVIITHYTSGMTVTDIARSTHMSRPAVYKILHRYDAMDSNTHKESETIEDAS